MFTFFREKYLSKKFLLYLCEKSFLRKQSYGSEFFLTQIKSELDVVFNMEDLIRKFTVGLTYSKFNPQPIMILKETVSVMLGDSSGNHVNARFTTVPLKALSGQL